MKTNLIFGILIFTALFSCNKNTNFHVKMINPTTNTPYTNTKFFIRSESGNLFGETVLKTEKEGVTNENGEAIVALNVKGNKSYYVTIEALPNICYINDIRKYYNDRTDKNPEFIFEIAPCAQLKRKIQNINCFDENDKIEVFIQNQMNSALNIPWIRYGCGEQETVATDVPMGLYNVNWTVTKNNITTNHSDSFYLEENEYKFYVIEY